MSVAYMQVHFRLDFFHGSKQYEPRSETDLGPYCLQYGLPKSRDDDTSHDVQAKG